MITPRTVIGARFMKAGRMYFFETGGVNDVDLNEFVIVRTELGEDGAWRFPHHCRNCGLELLATDVADATAEADARG